MDRKAQSALEYLMTYGWALIVIAIVIGVLIFVTGSATGGVTCQSQSTGIILKELAVTSSSAGITLQNATGGVLNTTGNISASSAGGPFSGIASWTVNPSANVAKNSTFTVQGTGSITKGTVSDANIAISYVTEGGLNAIAVINCSGTVA